MWVHEDIRGHLYEHYIPYIREATARGYVVIAPEYRGSIGYGQAFYDAIDYGGREVDDVVTAVEVLRSRYPQVDPGRIGIIGWSHGGLITLLSMFRNPSTFDAAAAIVPVTNLIERLDRKGVEKQRALIDPANRFGGPPPGAAGGIQGAVAAVSGRSPADPAARPRRAQRRGREHRGGPAARRGAAREKPQLAVTKVYDHPVGGHTFDRRVNMRPGSRRTRRSSGIPGSASGDSSSARSAPRPH